MDSAAASSGDFRAFGENVMRKVSWRLIPFLMLLYFIAFLDRVNVGFAALTMNKDLALSATVFGNGAGIFFIGYFFFEVPSNLILEKVGARRWIARIMISWGLISAGMVFAQGPKSFYALRFLLGLAEAGFFPGMILYLTYWFPSLYRGRVIGSFMMAIPISNVIGAPISGALLGLQSFGLRGWQWLFIAEGLPAVLLGFVVWFLMTDKPDKAHWLTQAEKNWLVGVLDAERKTRESVHHFTLWQALTSARVLLLALLDFGVIIALYGFSFWLPQMVKAFGGLSNLQVGFVTMIPYAFGAVAMYLWGRHSDRTGERVRHLFVASLFGGIGLGFSGFLSGSPVLALVALTFSSIGIMAMVPLFWTLPTALLSGTAAAGGIALIGSISNLGGYFGPSIMGYLRDLTHTYAYGMLVLAIFIACAGILALILGHNPALERGGMLAEEGTAKEDKSIGNASGAS
jgi:D-galactonate transporter